MARVDARRHAPGGLRGLRSACPPGPFLNAVHRVAASYDVVVPPAWLSRRGRGASALGGRRAHIVASDALLKEPAEIQEWSAAHEMGHVVLGHRLVDALPHSLPWLLAGLAMIGVAAYTPTPPQVWVVWVVVAVLLAANAACLLVSFRIFARRVRRSEIAADAFARDCGYRVTPEVTAWLAAAEPQLLQARAYRPWRMHPLPADRQHSD